MTPEKCAIAGTDAGLPRQPPSRQEAGPGAGALRPPVCPRRGSPRPGSGLGGVACRRTAVAPGIPGAGGTAQVAGSANSWAPREDANPQPFTPSPVGGGAQSPTWPLLLTHPGSSFCHLPPRKEPSPPPTGPSWSRTPLYPSSSDRAAGTSTDPPAPLARSSPRCTRPPGQPLRLAWCQVTNNHPPSSGILPLSDRSWGSGLPAPADSPPHVPS